MSLINTKANSKSREINEKPLYLPYQFYVGDPESQNQIKKFVNVPNIDTLDLEDIDHKALVISGLVSVFNDVLEEFTLIKCVMNEFQDEDWDDLIKYETIHERYGKINDIFINYSNNKNTLRHLCKLYNIFSVGFIELLDNESYNKFINAVKDYIQLMHDEAILVDETNANRQLLNNLKRAFVYEKKVLHDIISKKSYKLFKLQSLVEDTRVNGRMEINYTNSWESARVSQKTEDLKDKENYHRNITQDLNIKTNSENRIHHEIKRYTNERINDLRNEVEFWMEQYDSESDSRDNELGKFRIEIEIQKEKLEKTVNEYAERTKFIEDRLRLKEERREAEARRRIELSAAIRIQAWWRGTMVRKRLGRFRKLKKKGKKGKKDKKKKKK